jgi:hypothetical protein
VTVNEELLERKLAVPSLFAGTNFDTNFADKRRRGVGIVRLGTKNRGANLSHGEEGK